MHLAQRVGMEHRAKVFEKIQRKVRKILWDRAQIEEKEEMERSSPTEKPRKDGDLQQTQQESLMKGQAVRIESTRREESLLQLGSSCGQETKEESPKLGLM